MTSRRPMARSFSGNGRTSSFNDEESSPSIGRSETRNTYLSNVRPENRSTLCSVMAQLTEDIQPSFDTTLKSKAVSETCNVKFSCVVSGYPTPELKWYKDDMEMDRYCGLPKYEIRRNEKTHTLHLYNCTLDDAAIYQVSASNSKGIVSCSGVLEVGTMSEFMIHQRFFAKLKQKAENKKRELEESKRKGREPARGSPERSLRMRPVPPQEEMLAVQEPEAVEQPGAAVAAVVEPNAEESQANSVTPADNEAEKMDIAPKESPSTETSAKKVRIFNGLDAGVSSSGSSRRSSNSGRSNAMGNGGENSYDGGFGLAQFLAEALQTAEEKQPSGTLQEEKQHSGILQEEKQYSGTLQEEKQRSGTLQEEKQHSGSAGILQEKNPAERYASIADAGKEREREPEREEKEKDWALAGRREKEKVRERELSMEKDKQRQAAASSNKTHASDKDHDHHNMSISSVLHSVKDFFFGKHKKDSHDHRRHGEREADHPDDAVSAGPSPPPSRHHALREPEEVSEHLAGEVTPMDVGRPQRAMAVADGPPVTPERLKTRGNKRRVNVLHTEGLPPTHKPPSERAAESTEQGEEEAMEVMEVRSGAKEAASMPGPPALSEVAEEDSQLVADTRAVAVPQKEQSALVVLPEPEHQAATDDTQPSLIHNLSGSPQSRVASGEAPTAIFTGLSGGPIPPLSVVSAIEDEGFNGVTTKTLRGKDAHIGETGNERDIEIQENNSPDYLGRREKAEVKSETHPQTDINRVTELETPSLEGRIETCDSKTPKQVPVILIMDEDAVVTDHKEGSRLKTEAKSTPCLRERNVESSAALVPENLEKDGLKITQECSPMVAGSAEGRDLDTKEESLEGQGMGGVLQVAFASSVQENIEVSSPEELKTQEQAVESLESTGDGTETSEGNEASTLSAEREFKTEEKSQALVTTAVDESKSRSETQCEGCRVSVCREPAKKPNPDTGIFNMGGTIQNVPEKQIPRVNEQMIIPKIEIMEPDIEPVRPLAISALKPKSEPPILQRGDAIEVPEEMLSYHGVAISPVTGGFTLPRRGVQNGEILPPTEQVQDIAQPDDKTVTRSGEQPNKQTTRRRAPQAPRTSYASVPIIDVSCADDNKLKEDVRVFVKPLVIDTPQLDEAQEVPLFVVPPISIICDDSPPEIELPTQKETEPLVAMLRGTQNPEALRHNITDSNPSMLNRTPEITTDALSLGKPTEEITITEAEKVKPIKESDITVEGLQRDKTSISLGVKPPTSPAMSPGSLRRFLSKAAPGSDTAMAVPAITVGDSQSDKTGDELSGGSTPTSSLSCESSPRLKRKDSLSLIRSATPEELASGARRKIFIPKVKAEEGEGAGVGTGALDIQGKKENPFMSPSQARRAALLQGPAGQQSPPGERQENPFMSPSQARRAALLQGPAGQQSPPGERQENPFMSPSQARRAALLQGPAGQQSPPGERQENPFMSPSQARRAALLQGPAGQQSPPGERQENPFMSPSQARRAALLQGPAGQQSPPGERQENPFMSPSQARRAALLQGPAGQQSPPGERQENPFMSPSQARRAALLQPPTIQQTPPEERQEKPVMSPSQARRAALLQPPTIQQTPPEERQEKPVMSPSQARRAALLQPPTIQQTPPEERQEKPVMSPSQARRAVLLQPPTVQTAPEERQEKPVMSPSQTRRATLLQPPTIQQTPPEERQENPFMSPSQARRAALLQPPTMQQTPPEERQEKPVMSPSQARRAALLQPPTVQTPPEERQEKPVMSPSQARRAALLQPPTVQTPPEERQEKPVMSPSQARRATLLQPPTVQTPAMEKRSPLLSRRKVTLDVPKIVEETSTEDSASTKPEEKPAEKEKLDPFKAPQVIRKIRGEPFPDTSGHLKLWCQFFNVLSDSSIKWFRDEEEILEVKRSGGDESQMALAIVQASTEDCGVYGCTIKNEYGTDSTDYLLSIDVLSGILLKDELEVGEEIEMTPLLFSKGLANTGCWGEKFFGRVITEHSHLGEGCSHKASRVKVIYGLDPVYESGATCIMKIKNPIAYGTKAESNLTERNLEITKQECKVQNMIREYCKIFTAEARAIDNFGLVLEIIPQYLMYRPANSVPYATVETDVDGIYRKYCTMDGKRRLVSRAVSEVDQKCCTFQHWIHQWTHGNLLVTQMEGIEAKITNVRVVTKSKGYQGLTEDGSPEVFEQFLTHHQCNYYCGLLDLRTLKTMDSLQQPGKIKGSRSPLMNRRYSTGSFSPQLQKKGANSPQMSKKVGSSPKVPRKTEETEDNKTKTAETPVDQMR